MKKNDSYNPVKAQQAAMRKAIIETVGLSAWINKNRVIPDKKKIANRNRCRNVED